MICGLLRPDAGEVIVAGTAFWSDPQKAKRIMGVGPQELAIYEELRYGLPAMFTLASSQPCFCQRQIVTGVRPIDRPKAATDTSGADSIDCGSVLLISLLF